MDASERQCLRQFLRGVAAAIVGGIGAAHYVSDHENFFGIVFPTKHRIFGLQPDGHAAPEPLVVLIDMDQLVLS